MTSVSRDFGDHEQIDESQAHCADSVMFDGVVQVVVSGEFV